MWVGRATVFLVGLVVILALLFGVASTALGANGDLLKLGSLKNKATRATTLVGKVASGSAFVVQNPSGGSALELRVGQDVAPLKVNPEAGTATGLRAEDAAHADDAAKLGSVAASDYVRSNDSRLSNAQITFDVVNSGSTAWLIGDPSEYNSGNNANPSLFLMRGMTYRFNVNVSGHPFRLASSNSGPAYNVGVTNNDVQNGTLTFKVPMDAPDTLHYYCLAHPGMNGVISIPR
jgi:hypothetical protein